MGRATLEDLETAPKGKVGEIIDGKLHVSPHPAPIQVLAQSMLGAELGSAFQLGRGGPGGWLILDAPDLHLEADTLVPDVAGWRRERIPRLPEGELTTVPDWVCEVTSPATSYLDLVKKLPSYARYGVRHVWLVHPHHRVLQVYRRTEALWTLVESYADDDKVRAEPFDAIELNLAFLWDTGAPAE